MEHDAPILDPVGATVSWTVVYCTLVDRVLPNDRGVRVLS